MMRQSWSRSASITEIAADAKVRHCTLQREDNKFDSRAILVLTEAKQKLGYIPEKDNLIFSRLMDAGKLLAAKIRKIQQKGSFTQISIGIYLVDF
ncbi:MAG: HIRAN domain-containing protein [Eubacterium sp.]|nr:HIRAN domain-containing protein [Eubacterium sp.]